MNIVIHINGKKRYVRDRITVFEACREAGVYIPHFCYHPKLSIAANCRMCLVQVEKTPKPVPACATYVTDGMVIHTESPMAKAAQKGVMEFLLINHPLDCPICDQGGECQLQDLAVGYGSSCTRYGESKRVVVEKQLGPLITTVMTRCIHCTRCVRFGEEIGGMQELGMSGRGEHSEIMPFLEQTVDSELSGNMIDICPVGALNSKPFRFSARTWELRRSDGVAQHDAWGSMILLQSKDETIKRVLPREHEEINECWISDRDRFSYTALTEPTRLTQPHVRDPGSLKPRMVEWPEALDEATKHIRAVVEEHGPEQVGLLVSPSAVSEEAMLAADLMLALGSTNVDNRLRQIDHRLDGNSSGVPWLGCSIEELGKLESVLFVGSNPAYELPLLPVRLRRLQSGGKLRVNSIGSRDLSRQLQMDRQLLSAPSGWAAQLAAVCKAAAGRKKLPDWIKKLAGKPGQEHKDLVKAMKDRRCAVFVGAEACHGPDYSVLRQLSWQLAELLGGFHGVLVPGANRVGNTLAGAVPHHGFMGAQVLELGLNAKAMIDQRLKAYILLGCEPLDFFDAAAASEAFAQAKTIHIGSYMDAAREYADVLLPAAAFGERMGATVNLEGNAATMNAAVMPPGGARPAWKILRVLANHLDLGGFEYESLDQVRTRLIEAGDFATRLGNDIHDDMPAPEFPDEEEQADGEAGPTFERILETGHYATDQIVRRAGPLQETAIAQRSRQALLHPDDLAKLGAAPGDTLALSAGSATIECEAGADPMLVAGCIRCPLGVDVFAALGAQTRLKVEKVSGEQAKEASGAGG